MTTKESIAQRKRGMDRASEMMEDIRRIRAMNNLDGMHVLPPGDDARFLEGFLQMVCSHPVHERSQLVLTAEQRSVIDRLRKEHGLI